MNTKQWHEELFENHIEKYDNASFAQGTTGKCDFTEREINYNKDIITIKKVKLP